MKSSSCSIDPPIDYQRIRHTKSAGWLRALLYKLCVGGDGWPLRFHPPKGTLPSLTSPHLYVHLPFCKSLCPHCPYTKVRYDEEQNLSYGKSLSEEITNYLQQDHVSKIETLYFGGGTPSATPELIKLSIMLLRPEFSEDIRIGVEVHPADATRELLTDLKNWGVNRISLGVETFRPDLLKSLGRQYSAEEAENAITLANEIGFDCIDVNLICAIPGQSYSDTAADAQRCIDLGIEQLSAYTLFTFNHTPVGKNTARGTFPIYGDFSRLRALWAISSVCRKAGMERTSPWNYTRKGLEPYSTVTRESYVGFGAGAGSKVDGVFWFNTFSIPAYLGQEKNRPAIVLETTEKIRRFHWLYWQLYKTRVDGERYTALFDRDLSRDFRFVFGFLALFRMMKRVGKGEWQVTEFGAVWMHRIQQLFSITYIDEVWEQCQSEAWPEEVVLS